jgi:hypothetical protein
MEAMDSGGVAAVIRKSNAGESETRRKSGGGAAREKVRRVPLVSLLRPVRVALAIRVLLFAAFQFFVSPFEVRR